MKTHKPIARQGGALSSGEPGGERVLSALRRIMRSMDVYSHYLAHHHGLTAPQLLVLRALSKTDGSSAGQLARLVCLSQATLTGILDRLERKRLVKRRRDKLDKRRVIVRMTPAGARVVSSPPPLMHETFLKQFRRLEDQEQELILSCLLSVATMMETTASAAGGLEPGAASLAAAKDA